MCGVRVVFSNDLTQIYHVERDHIFGHMPRAVSPPLHNCTRYDRLCRACQVGLPEGRNFLGFVFALALASWRSPRAEQSAPLG